MKLDVKDGKLLCLVSSEFSLFSIFRPFRMLEKDGAIWGVNIFHRRIVMNAVISVNEASVCFLRSSKWHIYM